MNWEQCTSLICIAIPCAATGPRMIAKTAHRETVRRNPPHQEVQVFPVDHGISIEIRPDQIDLPVLGPLLAIHRRCVLPMLEILFPVHSLERQWVGSGGGPLRADGPLGAHPFVHEIAGTECEGRFALQLALLENVVPDDRANIEVGVGCSGRIFHEHVFCAYGSVHPGSQKCFLGSGEQQLFLRPVDAKLPHAVVNVPPVGLTISRALASTNSRRRFGSAPRR